MKPYLLITLLIACGSDSETNDPSPSPDGGTVAPITYEDPLVQIGNLPSQLADGISGIEELRVLSDGRLAYCTTRNGVAIIDASDPANLGHVTTLDTGPCQHLSISGDILYAARRSDTAVRDALISVWDLAQSPPVEIATFERALTSFEGVVADGNMLYVAAHDEGVLVLERTDAGLVERGSLRNGFENAWGIDVIGTTVYIADAGESLTVVDVSDPTDPVITGTTTVFGSPNAVAVHDIEGQLIAFVGAGYAGISLVDVSDPNQPDEVGYLEMPGSAQQVAYRDGYLYATTVNDVRVVDVRSVNQPTLIATETIASSNVARVRAVATRDDAVFVGEWSGLHSFQLSPDVLAPDVRAASARVEFFHVAVGDTSDYELSVINDGTAPLVGTIELEGAAFSVDAETLELAAGTGSEASSALTISYTPSGTGTDTGRLIIRSDDPDQAEYEIPLVGNGLGVQVGDRVPEIAAAMVGGGEWRAIERIGQIQVLSYFATHCSECRPEFTLLEDKIWQEYENQGVQVIGIDRTPVGSGNVKFVDEFVEDTRITFPVGFDLSISFDLLKGSTPETSSPSSVHLVIDRDGNVAHLTGIYEDDEGINDIAPVLEQLLAAP